MPRVCCAVKAGMSGGTMESGIGLFQEPASVRDKALHPYAFDPANCDKPVSEMTDKGINLAPQKSSLSDMWGAPFLMAPINELVVRRTSALLGYGASCLPRACVSVHRTLQLPRCSNEQRGNALACASKFLLDPTPVRARARLLVVKHGQEVYRAHTLLSYTSSEDWPGCTANCQRSHSGAKFSYADRAHAKNCIAAYIGSLTFLVVALAVRLAAKFGIMRKLFPAPGMGPTRAEMVAGHFSTTNFARGTDNTGKVITAEARIQVRSE